MTEHSAETLHAQAEEIWQKIGDRFSSLKPAERMAIPPQEMPSQAPHIRRHNIDEVALGYSETQARVEAARCLQCKNQPCVAGCPVNLPIRDFIAATAEGDYSRAIGLIKDYSLLPAVCGRVCPQETQCQAHCTVGKALKDVNKSVAIGRLERFVADWERSQGKTQTPAVKPATGKKVAVVGSGPD